MRLLAFLMLFAAKAVATETCTGTVVLLNRGEAMPEGVGCDAAEDDLVEAALKTSRRRNLRENPDRQLSQPHFNQLCGFCCDGPWTNNCFVPYGCPTQYHDQPCLCHPHSAAYSIFQCSRRNLEGIETIAATTPGVEDALNRRGLESTPCTDVDIQAADAALDALVVSDACKASLDLPRLFMCASGPC